MKSNAILKNYCNQIITILQTEKGGQDSNLSSSLYTILFPKTIFTEIETEYNKLVELPSNQFNQSNFHQKIELLILRDESILNLLFTHLQTYNATSNSILKNETEKQEKRSDDTIENENNNKKELTEEVKVDINNISPIPTSSDRTLDGNSSGKEEYVESKADKIENLTNNKPSGTETFTTPSVQIEHQSAEKKAHNSELLLAIQQQLETLSRDFQSSLKYDQHKEKIIDKLHLELQEYKKGIAAKILRPLFMDIINVIDDTKKLMRSLKEKKEETNTEKLWKILNGLPEDLEEVLYRNGVDTEKSSETHFNSNNQKILKAIPTDQKELDKSIKDRLKNGYRWEGKLIRHELVTVFKYEKS